MKRTAILMLSVCSLAAPAFAAPVTTSVPLQESAVSLRIGSSAKNGCAWGDLDAIEFEMKASSKPSLLVTLEPLMGEGAVQTKEIGGFDLRKGFVTKFNVPKGPAHYGLFVCKDSAGKQRCGGKTVTGMHNILNQYLAVGKPESETKGKQQENAKVPGDVKDPSDKIYYFAYIFVNGGKATVIKSDAVDADYAVLAAELAKSGVTEAQKVIDVVKRQNDTLRSVQPESDGQMLSINLPRIDKSQCGAVARPLPGSTAATTQ